MTIPPTPRDPVAETYGSHTSARHAAYPAQAEPVQPAGPSGGQWQQPPEAASAATRHLCAGAYLDDRFRRTSLNEVFHQPRRLVAPAPGYDLPTVLWHCMKARRLTVWRDAILVAMLFVGVCGVQLGLAATISVLGTIHFGVAFYRILRDAGHDIREGPGGMLRLLSRLRVLVLQMIVATIVYFGLQLLLLQLMGVTFLVLAGGSAENFSSALVAVSMLAIIYLIGIFAAPLVYAVVRQRELNRLVPGAIPEQPAPSQRFADIRHQLAGNMVVYSGYSPFVGTGNLIRTWAFAQRLVRAGTIQQPRSDADREFESPPFAAAELLGALRMHLARLRQPTTPDPSPEQHVPGLSVVDRVFVAGTETSTLVPHLAEPDVLGVIRYPTSPAKHYLVSQVTSWRGELVTTVYVHVAVQGRTLYVEFTSVCLPPCDSRYRVVDQVDGTGPVAMWKAIGRSIIESPATVLSAPINLVQRGLDAIVNAGQSRPSSGVPVGYDYGARISVRELGTSEFRNHSQFTEVDKHQRVVERRLLAAIGDFLDERGIDTSEFRHRAQTVLNAGAVNLGSGSLTVNGDAIGQQQNIPAAPATTS